MNIIFILMFLSIIIAPLLYFLYTFRHLQYTPKIILFVMTFLSLSTTIIKLFIKPYSSIFFLFTLTTQFYYISVFIIFILCLIYRCIIKMSDQKFNNRIMIIFGILAIILTSISYYTHFDKKETHYDITVYKESSLDSLTIGVISDIHLGSGTYIEDLANLVNIFNQKNYDIVCLTGDIFDESTPLAMVEPAVQTLSKIKSTYGIFAIDGNHEIYAQQTAADIYQQNNIHYLNESYVCVDGLFNIVGREDVVAHKETSINELFENIDTSLPTIVLDHNPRRYQEISPVSDLQISGHTHAGQIFPANLVTTLLYDNDYGLLQKENFSLVVTSGYGSWGFPIRFLTKCEYLDIKVTFSKK